ncbi:MAG: aldehyde dehydrogenase (NADP(+)) [Verrucomicrobiota bacterium]
MELQGTSLIGGGRGASAGGEMRAVNPATGEELEPSYFTASRAEIDEAVALATEAAGPYGRLSGKERAVFLRAIADEIEALGDALKERVMAETALPEPRVLGETARTAGQMRLFADVIDEGSWVRARIDHGDPDREPMSKPDMRSMLRPVGPVVVFGASNFPLALSTAGGDTASALAAGNPVIVKAHPAHLGTAEMMGQAVRAAVKKCGMPDGVFSLLFGLGNQLGEVLVQHPDVKAVGFTGSLKGGRALMDLAAARPEPIPFFAEMGSINPVFILPEALAERGEAIAAGLQGAVNLGVGQFCTNPGMVVLDAASDGSGLVEKLTGSMGETPVAAMLTEGISEAYKAGVASVAGTEGMKVLAGGKGSGDGAGFGAEAALFEISGEAFLANPELRHEVFGPSTILVKPSGKEEALAIARSMEGNLTATVHGTEADIEANRELIELLEKKVGRLVFNGYPVGVEVGHATVHGGPYPASADGQSTSIGTMSIYRFARPVAWQDAPESILPQELQEANPLGISRMVEGKLEAGS